MHVRSLLFQTANGTGINPAVRLKGHSAKLPSGLLANQSAHQASLRAVIVIDRPSTYLFSAIRLVS
jgi:hypothetical protein